MIFNKEISEIKKKFDKVIKYSQGIDNPKTDKLFEIWLNAKKDFIDIFQGNFIIEYPEKVSFNLSQKEKHSRILSFISLLVSRYGYDDLAEFIENQEQGFFNNITISDYKIKDDKVIKKGTKLVKAFKYFINNDKSLTDIQNEASRIIQEDKIEGTLCLSVHPLDYLSLSENTYNWRSCHALDGEYRAGNLSYMMDSSTVICYLKSEDNKKLPNFPEEVLWNSKKWRVLFHFSNDRELIFAGRQYPFEIPTGLDFVLKNLISKYSWDNCIRSGFWMDWTDNLISQISMNNEVEVQLDDSYIPLYDALLPLSQVIYNADGSKHYNDVLYSSCYNPVYTVNCTDSPWSKPYMLVTKDTFCEVGAFTYCLYCGKEEVPDGADSMMCYECELKYGNSDSDLYTICDCCGRRIFTDDSIYIQSREEEICEECYANYCQKCDNCEEIYYNEDITYNEDEGIYLCERCYGGED